MHKQTKWLLDSATHHAAMVALWLCGCEEVSIVQCVKSLNILKALCDSVEDDLRAPEEEPKE